MATINYKQLSTPEANLIELLSAQNQDGTYSAKLMGNEPFSVLAAKTIYNAYNDIEDNMAADVEGPATSTNNALARFNGTTGKIIKNSNAILTDAGALSLASNLTVSGGTGTIDATSGTASATLNLVGRSSGTAKTASILANSGGSLVLGAEGAGSSLTIAANTGNTTVAYNLTVSGTGTSSFAGSLQANGGTAQSVNTPALRIGNDKILVWLDSSSTTTNAGFLWYDSSNILRIGAENGTRIQVAAATTTISNNLTVSGTGGITVNPNQNAQTLVKVSNANAGASADSTFQLANNSSTTNWGMRSTGAAAYFALDAGSSYLWYNGTTSLVIGATDAAGIIKFNTGGLSERMRLNASGNLLLKSDGIDSGNGKLQLATHTTSAGGIGFGTDTSAFATSAGFLAVRGIGNNQSGVFEFQYTSGAGTPVTGAGYVGVAGSAGALATGTAIGDVVLRGAGAVKVASGGGTTALTLDASQNATFAGGVVTLGDYAGDQDVIIAAQSTGVGYLRWRPTASGTNAYGFSIAYDNPNTKLSFLRHEFSTAGTEWLSVARSTGDATFAGDVTVSGGNMGVGIGASSSIALAVTPSTLTGNTQYGVAGYPVFSSAATAAGYSGYFEMKTAASAFTMSVGRTIFVEVPTLGAGSAITTQSGIYVSNQGSGAITNAYGIDIAAQSGATTRNVAIRAAGNVMFTSLPTSSAGLPAGSLWNDAGTLKIV